MHVGRAQGVTGTFRWHAGEVLITSVRFGSRHIVASVTSLSPSGSGGTPRTGRKRGGERSVGDPGGVATPAERGRAIARAAAVLLIALEGCALLGIVVGWLAGVVRGGGLRGSEVFLAVFALGVAAALLSGGRQWQIGRAHV